MWPPVARTFFIATFEGLFLIAFLFRFPKVDPKLGPKMSSPTVENGAAFERRPDGVAARKESIQDRRESFIADVYKANQQTKFEKPFVPKNITPYQAEKLRALFERYYGKCILRCSLLEGPYFQRAVSVSDVDKDGVITEKDIECLNEVASPFL